MAMTKRIAALFLVAAGLATMLNLALTPVYHDGSTDYPVWEVLNWFMAAATLIALVVSYLRRRAMGTGTDAIERMQAGALFYGAVALAMLFFWEWFWSLNPDSETGDAVTSHIIYYPIVDALFVVVVFAVGRRLWNDKGPG